MSKHEVKKAVLTPTIFDIAWAAGLYEGEGNSSRGSIYLAQVNVWVLERLQNLFGGSVRLNSGDSIYRWLISGSRARGFAMTVFKFLSPKRKMQIVQHLFEFASEPRTEEQKRYDRDRYMKLKEKRKVNVELSSENMDDLQ